MSRTLQYQYSAEHLENSEPHFFKQPLPEGQMILNMGPQHPSTHGVLRLEILTDGEIVLDVVPHVGYLHRCFEKHAEALAYNQIIPYVDRMDYLAAMNSEHIYAMAVEKLLGITERIPKRVEYIRVLVAELNRIASHFVAIGTYGIDIGAFTPFLWLMRDREHILRLLEWTCGARMLYNYIWVGGLYYDLPIGFEERCQEFTDYLRPKLKELQQILIENKIFKDRTANVGILPLETAINAGATGPMLRGSGLAFDLRKVDGYSVYPELDFDIPVGKGEAGALGDCWDRTWVRVAECYESLKIIEQCLLLLKGKYQRTPEFNPREAVPKKLRTQEAQTVYFRGESPKGELGFFIQSIKNSDVPYRMKARSACFMNLSLIGSIAKGCMLSDLVAIVGSLDLVMGEVDR